MTGAHAREGFESLIPAGRPQLMSPEACLRKKNPGLDKEHGDGIA